jgi:hypothetical protein
VEKTGSRSLHQTQELVSRQGRATAGQLAEQLRLTTGAVTGLIDRMEAAGYFRRNGDLTDRRTVVIQLTPKGANGNGVSTGPLDKPGRESCPPTVPRSWPSSGTSSERAAP